MQIQELQESIKRIDSDYQGQIKIKEKQQVDLYGGM